MRFAAGIEPCVELRLVLHYLQGPLRLGRPAPIGRRVDETAGSWYTRPACRRWHARGSSGADSAQRKGDANARGYAVAVLVDDLASWGALDSVRDLHLRPARDFTRDAPASDSPCYVAGGSVDAARDFRTPLTYAMGDVVSRQLLACHERDLLQREVPLAPRCRVLRALRRGPLPAQSQRSRPHPRVPLGAAVLF